MPLDSLATGLARLMGRDDLSPDSRAAIGDLMDSLDDRGATPIAPDGVRSADPDQDRTTDPDSSVVQPGVAGREFESDSPLASVDAFNRDELGADRVRDQLNGLGGDAVADALRVARFPDLPGFPVDDQASALLDWFNELGSIEEDRRFVTDPNRPPAGDLLIGTGGGVKTLLNDALHVTGFTIPYRAISNLLTARRADPQQWVENRDYNAFLFLVVEAREGRTLVSRFVKKLPGGSIKLYHDGSKVVATMGTPPKPGDPPVPPPTTAVSDRSLFTLAPKGDYARFAETTLADPFERTTAAQDKLIKSQRFQYVNDVALIRQKTPPLLLNHKRTKLRYFVTESFVLLEPRKAKAGASTLGGILEGQILDQAKTALQAGADAAGAAIGGGSGLVLSKFGKLVLGVITELLKQKGGDPGQIITVPLTKRALDGKRRKLREQEIPIRNNAAHSRFATKIGTAPELWLYDKGTADFVKKESVMSVMARQGTTPRRLETTFQFSPSVRLLVRRTQAQVASPDDGGSGVGDPDAGGGGLDGGSGAAGPF